jgi:hypothetical protein
MDVSQDSIRGSREAWGPLRMLFRSVMVHFLCHLDWSIGCWDLGWTSFLGTSVRVFLGGISIRIWRLRKAQSFPSVGGHQSPNRTKRQRREDLLWLTARARTLTFSCPQTGFYAISLKAFRFGLELHQKAFWFSGIWTHPGAILQTHLGLQLADARSWKISVSIIIWNCLKSLSLSG